MNPKVTIIILNWNGKEDTIECLGSLKHITYPNNEILLVDNGSTDGSVECFRNRHPEIEIIENEENLGFAEGNNVGIRRAMDEGADYVLLLNNDTVVDPEFLGELVNVVAKNPKIGFAGPKIYYYDYNGKKDVINFAGGRLNMWKGTARHIGKKEIDSGQYDKIKKVDYAQGSCLLGRIEMISKIGLLDPEYFTYWEEDDWCMRGRKAGYDTVFVPKAKIWHKISTSDVGKIKMYFLGRNQFFFMKKNASVWQYLSFLLYFFTFNFWFTSGIFLLHHKDFKGFASFCKGVIAGLKNNNNL